LPKFVTNTAVKTFIMSYLTNFNSDTAKQILMDIIRCVNQPENSKKLSEAKASAGKEMILMMQHVNTKQIKTNNQIV